MLWHDVQDSAHKQLDELAASYSIHPLHIEDCRQADRRTKLESGDRYLFISLKPAIAGPGKRFAVADLALFVGSDFIITVHDTPVPLIEALRALPEPLRPDQILYRVLDSVVDSYLPMVDELEDTIEQLQDQVVGRPRPDVLEDIGEARASLLQLRRVLNATRHIAFQLRHVPHPLISQELLPFLRDVHDDLAIILDALAGERDRLAGLLDIYLSSVANRTTEATRTLTLLGTIALPALVITGLFGMNIDYPRWARSPSMFVLLVALTLAVTGFLLWYLKRGDYLPGGTTARGGRESTRR